MKQLVLKGPHKLKLIKIMLYLINDKTIYDKSSKPQKNIIKDFNFIIFS